MPINIRPPIANTSPPEEVAAFVVCTFAGIYVPTIPTLASKRHSCDNGWVSLCLQRHNTKLTSNGSLGRQQESVLGKEKDGCNIQIQSVWGWNLYKSHRYSCVCALATFMLRLMGSFGGCGCSAGAGRLWPRLGGALFWTINQLQ